MARRSVASALGGSGGGTQSKRPSVQVGDPFAEKLLIEASLELIERGLVEGLQDLGAGRHHLRDLGDGGPGRDGHPRRPRRDPPTRAGHGALRGDDLGVAGADVRRGPARPLGGRPRRLRALGPAGRDHRAGHRRRRHRGRRGRAGRRRPAPTGGARDRADAGRGPDQRRDRPRAARRAALSTGGPRRRPARRSTRAIDSRSGAWTRAPSCSACSARRTCRRVARSSSSTTPRSARTRSRARVAAPRCCASRTRPRPSSRPRTATRPSGRWTRTWARRSASPRRPATSRSPAPGRWASRTASTTATRPVPRRSGSSAKASAAWAMRAGRSACRSPAATSRSTTSRPDGPIAPTPEIGVVGLLDDIGRLVGPAFVTEGDTILLVGESTPGLSGSAYAALAGTAVEDGPPALDLAREAALQAFIREAIDARARGQRPGRVGRWPRRRPRRGRDVERAGGAGPARGRHLAGRRAVRREPVAARPDGASPVRPGVDAARPAARPADRGARRRRWRPPRRSSSSAPAPRAPARSAAAASPMPSRCRSPTSATPGTTAWPAPSAGRADGMCGVFGAVTPGAEPTEAAAIATLGPVRAPAPRPGIGRRGRQRRRAADALQGPRDDQHGARRAAAAEPARHAGHRPLPLLDDRLDDLGERPADVPPGAAASHRDRPQRQPRQHARAARPAARRPVAPARLHRHGAADGAARRRARRGHGRGAAPGPAARPRRVQPRDPRPEAGHRRARPARLPAARPGPAAGQRPGGRRPERRHALGRRGAAGLVPVLGDRRPSTSSAPSSSATSNPARSWSWSRGGRRVPIRYAEANPKLCVFELIYFARPDSYMEGRNLYEVRRRMGEQLAIEHAIDADLVMPVPDTGRPGRGRLRRGERPAVPRGDVPQPLRRAHVHPAVGRAAPPGRDDQAQPAARGRGRQAPDRGGRLDRARHDDQADRRAAAQGRARPRSTSGSARRRSTTRASTASTPRSRPS